MNDVRYDGAPSVAQLAHADAQEALARTVYPAGTLRMQLALALQNALAAGWPRPELVALAEALRAALLAEYVAKRMHEGSDLHSEYNLPAVALAHTEPWIRQALDQVTQGAHA